MATTKSKKPAVFLVKSEPTVYPFSKLVEDGRTQWDGIRSFEARNNLRLMKEGDLCLFYHSNVGKEIVGIARVVAEARPDPTAPGEDWSAVDLAPVQPLVKPVTLATIKATKELATINVLTKPRLSVVQITQAELTLILKLAETKLRS